MKSRTDIQICRPLVVRFVDGKNLGIKLEEIHA